MCIFAGLGWIARVFWCIVWFRICTNWKSLDVMKQLNPAGCSWGACINMPNSYQRSSEAVPFCRSNVWPLATGEILGIEQGNSTGVYALAWTIKWALGCNWDQMPSQWEWLCQLPRGKVSGPARYSQHPPARLIGPTPRPCQVVSTSADQAYVFHDQNHRFLRILPWHCNQERSPHHEVMSKSESNIYIKYHELVGLDTNQITY